MSDNKNENTNTLSPTPIKAKEEGVEGEVLMNFNQAMEVVVIGKKVHKLQWKDKEYYGFLEKDVLILHNPEGTTDRWILSKGDLEGTDYVII